jgi:hypothetical protein
VARRLGRRILPTRLVISISNIPIDDSLQAFVIAYNSLTQEYVDCLIRSISRFMLAPVTGPADWVAAGIYGIMRPVLSSWFSKVVGPYILLQPARFNI